MACDQDDLSPATVERLKDYNFFFTIFFLIEALFKIFILGFSNYIHNAWNK